LNVCLKGGCLLATSRGEIIQPLKSINSKVTLIKPKNLGISAGEAYRKYAEKTFKPQNNMTEKIIDAIDESRDIKKFLYNDLEYAIFDDYQELQKIKSAYPNAIMSGSGSTYFILGDFEKNLLDESYQVFSSLEFISYGVSKDE
ncbi:MAG: hypothetical protein IKA30_04340, partial [Alphaproteobacteria bacterium]|nr:hypothetical protein [Alphaproteobacteria bacterium]